MSTVRRSQAEIRRTGGRVDSRRVRGTTDKDISKWIAEDPDTAPELPPEVRPHAIYTPSLPDVRRLRERLGLTQAEFAKRFGLSRNPGAVEFVDLAAALGIDAPHFGRPPPRAVCHPCDTGAVLMGAFRR